MQSRAAGLPVVPIVRLGRRATGALLSLMSPCASRDLQRERRPAATPCSLARPLPTTCLVAERLAEETQEKRERRGTMWVLPQCQKSCVVMQCGSAGRHVRATCDRPPSIALTEPASHLARPAMWSSNDPLQGRGQAAATRELPHGKTSNFLKTQDVSPASCLLPPAPCLLPSCTRRVLCQMQSGVTGNQIGGKRCGVRG